MIKLKANDWNEWLRSCEPSLTAVIFIFFLSSFCVVVVFFLFSELMPVYFCLSLIFVKLV